jgi:hypothetical protein
MKTSFKVKSQMAAFSAFLLLSNSSMSNAGLVDLLRGEQTPAPQRVAFVGAARVQQVEGEVQRLAGVEQWIPLKSGDTLNPGDIVRTSSGSAILLMLESESFVKVTPNTFCRLVPLAKNWDPAVLSGQEQREGFVVRSCRGNAYAASTDGNWTPLTVNAVLAEGTQVRTEPGAFVDLFDTKLQRPTRISGSVEIKLDEHVLAQRIVTPPTLAAARR